MTRPRWDLRSEALAGALAGLAGAVAIMAMRSFDRAYAPKTIPPTTQDPADFAVDQTERLTGLEGSLPRSVEKAGAVSMRLACGMMTGLSYALIRGRQRQTSVLRDGVMLGAALYATDYVASLPLLGLAPPVWKQSFPQIGGELLRHAAFGVTTAAVYGAIDRRL